MRKKLSILALAMVAMACYAVTVLWYSQAPVAANLNTNDIFLIERTTPHTNLYASLGQLAQFIQTNITTGGGGDQVWTNESGVISPSPSQTTNQLKFISGYSDGPDNAAVVIDTANLWTYNTNKLLQFKNKGTNIAYVSEFGSIVIGKRLEPYWSSDNQDFFIGIHETVSGDPSFGVFQIASVDDVNDQTNDSLIKMTVDQSPTGGASTIFGSYISGGLDREFSVSGGKSGCEIFLYCDNDYSLDLFPTVSDGQLPYKFSTPITHTSGLLLSVMNNQTNKFTVDWKGSITIAGQTNQITFGSSNTPPVSSAAPVKWISVNISGETNQYRLPLYE